MSDDNIVWMPGKQGLDKEQFVLRSKALELAIDWSDNFFSLEEGDSEEELKKLLEVAHVFKIWLNNEQWRSVSKNNVEEIEIVNLPEDPEIA